MAGRRPGVELLDLELEHAGDELAHVAQQLVDAAGGRRGVPAALLHRRAEHVAAVAARDEVRLLAADRALDQAGAARVAQPQHLALDRPHRHARVLGHARAARRARRRRRRPRPRATIAPSVELDAGRRARRRRAARGRARPRPHARRASRSAATSRRGSIEWSPAMSSASRIVGASAGSSAARLASGAAARPRSPSVAPERDQAVERLGLVAVARDDQRADARSPGRPAPRELGAEGRVAARALQARARAARARRTRPRRPARACPRRRATRRARRRRARRRAAPRCGRAPRAREADRARRRRRRRRSCADCHWLAFASLRRHDPDQVRRSAARCRPLSPIAGSRVLAFMVVRLMGDPTRAPRRRPPVPRLRRPAAGLARGGDARRRRPRPAARQGARRRRARGRGARVPRCRRRARRAVHPQRPARTWSTACGADGVHVGQDDGSPAAARAAVGPGPRSSAAPRTRPTQAAAADADPDVDYLAVGPVHATPTKPGRPAAGLDYVALRGGHA